MSNNKITMRDVVFLSILSVVLFLASSLVMPIVMFTQIMALRQLFAAPIFAIFCAIGLRKVPKRGALFIIGFITGMILLFMSLAMFLNNVIGALIIELLVIVIFKDYKNRKAIIFASALYIPATIPISLIATMILKGRSLSEMLGSPFEAVAIPIASVALGFAGAFIGMKIADELVKAGKLK